MPNKLAMPLTRPADRAVCRAAQAGRIDAGGAEPVPGEAGQDMSGITLSRAVLPLKRTSSGFSCRRASGGRRQIDAARRETFARTSGSGGREGIAGKIMCYSPLA